MTQPEYEQKKQECWEEYVSKHGMKNAIPEEPFSFTFDRAYALGKQEIKQETKQETKQEKDADTVIQGWVARDEDNTLTLFYGSNKPSKEDGDDYWSELSTGHHIKSHSFDLCAKCSDEFERFIGNGKRKHLSE